MMSQVLIQKFTVRIQDMITHDLECPWRDLLVLHCKLLLNDIPGADSKIHCTLLANQKRDSEFNV